MVPRKLRVEYPGAMYHVMSRRERREDIYLDDVDRQDFLKTLAEPCQKTDWQVHAFCLMLGTFKEGRQHKSSQIPMQEPLREDSPQKQLGNMKLTWTFLWVDPIPSFPDPIPMGHSPGRFRAS